MLMQLRFVDTRRNGLAEESCEPCVIVVPLFSHYANKEKARLASFLEARQELQL